MSISEREQAALDKAPKQLLIGGEWRDAAGGATLAVEDPSTGESLCEIADATPADAQAAIDAAADAQADWAADAPNERSEILWRAFEALGERADELALLMTLEMGKPLAESKAEIVYAAEFFRWFSGEALRIDGYYKHAGNGASRVLVMRQPVGPCYFITPWNFPNAMGTRKIGPAIAAGCTMVVKPAQQTPLSMLALAELLTDCGLPDGVLNVVTGSSSSEISKPIIADPRLRKLSFTGSTEVGRKLIAQAAENVLKVSMELGGNAPFLIFEDADLDDAVAGAMIAKMRNIGEACTSANRFHVAEGVADEFADQARRAHGRAQARPRHRGGRRRRPADRRHPARQGRRAGRRRRRARRGGPGRGTGPDGAGYFYEPTVIAGVPDDARVLSEEIFGPVAPVKGFSSEEEAIAAANDTEYGLVAYVYTSI